MSDNGEREAIVTISKERIQDLIAALQDATSTPNDEFNDDVDLIDGTIYVSKSIADGSIFWIKTTQMTD